LVVAVVDDFPVMAKISGIVRGLIREGVEVKERDEGGRYRSKRKKRILFYHL